MRYLALSRLKIGLIVVSLFLLQGCAAKEERDARLVYEEDDGGNCRAGFILQCEAAMGRRFGSKRTSDENCSCQAAGDINVLRGPLRIEGPVGVQ